MLQRLRRRRCPDCFQTDILCRLAYVLCSISAGEDDDPYAGRALVGAGGLRKALHMTHTWCSRGMEQSSRGTESTVMQIENLCSGKPRKVTRFYPPTPVRAYLS